MTRTTILRTLLVTLIYAISWNVYAFTFDYGCQGNITVYVGEELTVWHPFPYYAYVNPNSGGWYLRIKTGSTYSHVQEAGGGKIVSKDYDCCTVKGMWDNTMQDETLELHCYGTRKTQGEEYVCYWNVTVKRKPSTNDIKINEQNFPDVKFRDFLTNQYYGKDGIIDEDEIKNIKIMSLSNRGIKSLKGIEFFAALTELSCEENSLTSLDVSQNTSLKKLRADNNLLKGESMDALIASLPKRLNNDGELYLYYSLFFPETNWITRTQVAAAKAKGWTNYNCEGCPAWDGKAPIKGDANDNGVIDEADIMFVVNYVMSKQYGVDKRNADVNGDKDVNAADIVEIVKIIKAQ